MTDTEPTPDDLDAPDDETAEHGDIITRYGKRFRVYAHIDPHTRLQLLQVMRLALLEEQRDPDADVPDDELPYALTPEVGMTLLDEALNMLIELIVVMGQPDDPTTPTVPALVALDHVIEVEEKLIQVRHLLADLYKKADLPLPPSVLEG